MWLEFFYVFGIDVVGVVVLIGVEVMCFYVGDCVVCGNWYGVWVERMVVLESSMVLLLVGVDF